MPRAQFANAVAYSSSALKMAQLVGPALGGALIAWTDDGVYQVILALFAISGAALAFIAARLKVQAREPFSLAMVLGGFTYIWADKVVLGAISIALLAVLFGAIGTASRGARGGQYV